MDTLFCHSSLEQNMRWWATDDEHKAALSEGFGNFYSVLAQDIQAYTPQGVWWANDAQLYNDPIESDASRPLVSQSHGEDHELAIMRLLWDLYDAGGAADERGAAIPGVGTYPRGDLVTMGYDGVYTLMKENVIKSGAQLWEVLLASATVDPQIYGQKAFDCAALFEAHGLAVTNLSMTVSGTTQNTWDWSSPVIPKFHWTIPKGYSGTWFDLYDEFGIKFFAKDTSGNYEEIYDSGLSSGTHKGDFSVPGTWSPPWSPMSISWHGMVDSQLPGSGTKTLYYLIYAESHWEYTTFWSDLREIQVSR